MYGQKRQCVARENNAADHRTNHGDQDKAYQDGLQYTQRRIFPPHQIAAPFAVQDMVNEKQHEHANAQPFVGSLSDQLIGHQHQQYGGHSNIHAKPYNYFWIHLNGPLLQVDGLLRIASCCSIPDYCFTIHILTNIPLGQKFQLVF